MEINTTDIRPTQSETLIARKQQENYEQQLKEYLKWLQEKEEKS